MISSVQWNLENLKKIIPELQGFKYYELYTFVLKEISGKYYDCKDEIIQEFLKFLNEFLQKNVNLKEILVKSEKWIEYTLRWVYKKSKTSNGN